MLAIFLMFLTFDDPPAVPAPPPVPPLVRSEEPAAAPPVRDRRAKWFAERLAAERQVRRPARPFFPRVHARLDANLLRRVPVLADMEPYETANTIQVSGNRTGRGANWFISRSSLPKWLTPGGLENVKGWTGQLFHGKKNRPRYVFERADPLDIGPLINGEYWGSEWVYKRYSSDGDIFAEVLRNADGEPFEVRVSEKADGEWQHYVALSDTTASPLGYKRPTRSECIACHTQAGAGQYGEARIPGWDRVFSETVQRVQ